MPAQARVGRDLGGDREVAPLEHLTRMATVAVVGNPNAGKTTLFNALTGSHQKVGNYPGVTVERVEGELTLDGQKVRCLDVPGLYSLEPVSEDERVAAEVLRGEGGESVDLLVCVIDATNLERNLYLFTQIAEIGLPVVVALTMVDRLSAEGRDLDLPVLVKHLGTEVVPVVGHRGEGLAELRAAIARKLAQPEPPQARMLPGAAEGPAFEALRERLARAGLDLSSSSLRRALLEPTPEIQAYLVDFPDMAEGFVAARRELDATGSTDDVGARYDWTASVQAASVRRVAAPRRSLTDRIDALLVHRVFGLAIFVGMMYLVFQSIYSFAAPLMDAIDGGFGWVAERVSPLLDGSPVLQSLVVDGLIRGVGSMLVFLPQILILFFFIAVLEGTGYLARAAFLMDRLLGWCGLNGRAFIPLLSSYACAIPGIMAARVMPDSRGRLATILVAPLMSCSARLPVYLLLIGAFIQPKFGAFWAGFALFAMHFLGLLVAIPIMWVLNRGVLKGKRLPFLLELPPYQWPKWRDVWLTMYFRGKVFVQTAGTIIVVMSFLIWLLSYFPRLGERELDGRLAAVPASVREAPQFDAEKWRAEEQLANSVLGRFGKAIEPVFIPAGFDWRITTSILAAFPAREVVVPSMGILFGLGGDVDEESTDLRGSMQSATWPGGRPLFTPLTAVGLMVFFSLCAQCMATLATVKRETNSWRWAWFMFAYMTALAYVAAVLIHQIGTRL